jgi:flavin reductase (DIM6/NTAB) family NADH-FMN oxidoreductase RutF
MLFDFAELSGRERYKLLVATITPRPIAWVVSQNASGRLNAAPFSFFNAFSGDPPVIGIGVSSHEPGRPKDTRRNIHETGEFVVNLVSEEAVGAMIVTAIEFEEGVDELAQAQMATLPSLRVKPPRIATSPVAMECELIEIVELGQDNGLVLGRVLAMHVQDEMVLDAEKRLIDTPRLNLVGRMHGRGWYARTRDLFEAPRIARERWMLREENP